MPQAEAGFPPESKVAERGYIVGTIEYCDGSIHLGFERCLVLLARLAQPRREIHVV